jgi:hypothetical protein
MSLVRISFAKSGTLPVPDAPAGAFTAPFLAGALLAGVAEDVDFSRPQPVKTAPDTGTSGINVAPLTKSLRFIILPPGNLNFSTAVCPIQILRA